MIKNFLRNIVLGTVIALSPINPVGVQAEVESNICWEQKVLDDALAMTTQSVQDYYNAQDYSTIISYVSVNSIDGYTNLDNGVRGVADYVNKVIIVEFDETNPKLAQAIYLHEIGHVIDSIDNHNGRFSSSEEFHNAFVKESHNLTTSDEVYKDIRQGEFFSECFSLYFRQPSELQSMCPKSYEYIDTLVKGVI